MEQVLAFLDAAGTAIGTAVMAVVTLLAAGVLFHVLWHVLLRSLLMMIIFLSPMLVSAWVIGSIIDAERFGIAALAALLLVPLNVAIYKSKVPIHVLVVLGLGKGD